MKRRSFLKKIVKLSPLVILPAVATDILSQSVETKKSSETFIPFVKWDIDDETKNIIYQSGWQDDTSSVSIQDFHTFLKDEWNSKEGMGNDFPFTIREFGPDYNYRKSW